MNEPELSGLFVALTTPFGDDVIDELSFEENLRRLEAYPLDGYLVAGTTGEMTLLTLKERCHLVRFARGLITPSRRVIAGIAGDSVAAAVDEAEEALDAGAGAVLLGPPANYRRHLGDTEVRRFFAAVAERTSVPLLLYSNPDSPGGEIPLPVLLDLLEHARIAGVKESSSAADRLEYCLAGRRGKGVILIGSAGLFCSPLSLRADGGILALANLYPGEFAAIRARARAKEPAGDLTAAVAPAVDFFRSRGIPGLKAALDAAGAFGGAMRAPFDAVSDEIRQEATALVAKRPPLPPTG